MAKDQHGNSRSFSNNGKGTDRFDPEIDSSDDDDAPEEVTFEEAKASALRSIRDAIETAKREKQSLKEKRRKRQELFQEQKKRSLLPADILEEIDTPTIKRQIQSEVQADDEKNESATSEKEENEEEDDALQDEAEVATQQNSKRKLTDNYRVMSLKKKHSATNSQQQTALDFLQNRLYGPLSGRTTSNALLSLQNKRGLNKSAAVEFAKKNWASKDKEKAEKLKKRWIHKQKNPLS